MEEEIEQKQNFLRTEIIEGGYDPDIFTKYIINIKGEDGFDLDNLSMKELTEIVHNFKKDFEEAKRQGIIKGDEAESDNKEEESKAKSNQAQQTNNKPKESNPSTQTKAVHRMQDIKPSSQMQSQSQSQSQSKSNQLQQPKQKPSTIAKKQFFPQQSNPLQTFKSKEVDGFVKVDKEDPKDNTTKVVLEDNKGIPSSDYATPLQNYTQLVACTKLEKTPLTNLSKVVIEVKSPEIIKSGLFSFTFLQFTIETKELNYIAVRKLSDFEWFYTKINELFPGVAIPYFPLSKFFEKSTEEDIEKKMSIAQKFINSIIKTKVIRSSKLFHSFISLSKVDWQNQTVILDKKQNPMSLQQFSTIEGMIEINISKEMDDNASTVQNHLALRSGLHKRLHLAYENVVAQMSLMSDAFLELSNTYKDLSLTYSKGLFVNDSINKVYTQLGTLYNEWSNGYKKQINFFNNELKYFFKYIHKELDCFSTLIEDYKSARGKYFDYSTKLLRVPFATNAQQTELLSLKHSYGYFMKQVLNEYTLLDHKHQKRIKKHFETLTERKPEFIVDYMTFIQLVNFNY